MNWVELLEAFEKTAKNFSFARAAREIGVNTPAVSKRIQQLENALKTTLFVRTTRKVILTEEGKLLLSRITPLLHEWQDIHQQLLDYQTQPQGILTVYAPSVINSAPVFVRLFNKFLQLHPKMRLQINTTANPISLTHVEADILIATERYLLDPEAVIGKCLITLTYQCYATTAYLESHGRPKTPNDLYQHNCLTHDNTTWEFDGEDWLFHGNLLGNSGDCLTQACKLGMGIFYGPEFVVKDELAAGSIVPLLTEYKGKKIEIKLYYKKQQYMPRKIRAFLDFILDEKKMLEL